MQTVTKKCFYQISWLDNVNSSKRYKREFRNM